MPTLKENWKNFRDHAVMGATLWKKYAVNAGIKLSLRDASPRVRFSLMTKYEMDDARLCQKYLNKEDRILELGSSIGFIALHCMKNIGIKDFAMVETNQALFPIMKENFELNEISMPCYLNIAAGHEDGTANFNISEDYYASSLTDINKIQNIITIKQQSIPSIISQLDFTPNTLIMDIEGAEVQIPIEHFCLFEKIIIEFHGRFVGYEAIEKIISQLLSNGYNQVDCDGYSTVFIRSVS